MLYDITLHYTSMIYHIQRVMILISLCTVPIMMESCRILSRSTAHRVSISPKKTYEQIRVPRSPNTRG